jgi:hypothetical protein
VYALALDDRCSVDETRRETRVRFNEWLLSPLDPQAARVERERKADAEWGLSAEAIRDAAIKDARMKTYGPPPGG